MLTTAVVSCCLSGTDHCSAFLVGLRQSLIIIYRESGTVLPVLWSHHLPVYTWRHCSDTPAGCPSPQYSNHLLPFTSILKPLAARHLNTHTTGCPSPQYSHHWLPVTSILTPLAARHLSTHTTGCPSPQYSHHWLPVTSILTPLAARHLNTHTTGCPQKLFS